MGKWNSNVDFCFFVIFKATKGHFRQIKYCISFLSIFRFSLGLGLNYVRCMDHFLIFGPSWAQNTIFPLLYRQLIVDHLFGRLLFLFLFWEDVGFHVENACARRPYKAHSKEVSFACWSNKREVVGGIEHECLVL